MSIKALTLAIILSGLIFAYANAEPTRTIPLKNYELSTGEEPLPDGPVYPLNPGFVTDSPGIIVGTTYYDQQTNGSTGNRIAVADDLTRHVCWTNLFGWPYPPAPRHVYHNYIDNDGNVGHGGQVDRDAGAGFTTIDIIFNNLPAIVFHSFGGINPTFVTLVVGYNCYDPPDMLWPQTPENPGRLAWPYITVDRNDNIHIIATETVPILGQLQRMGYTNSTDGGNTWSNVYHVDNVIVISSILDASPVSDRVVLAYSKPCDTTSQRRNDIVYIVSEDGLNWDFHHGRINVTNYDSDDDSLWAYTDIDVIFDYNGYVHIVWNAIRDGNDRTYLFHYNEETGEITEITHHPDSLWLSDICGGWNLPICKMNLGVYDNSSGLDGIFVTWSQFDTSDVSLCGYGNSELFMSYSTDGGTDWAEPENLTNSPTPNCTTGACDSDHWSSLADVVNDSLHIIYINDKDAGSVMLEEGCATENQVMYLAYPNPLAISSIDQANNRPIGFSLFQNYPNPFNVNTSIEFYLNNPGRVTLEIFNITGSRVTVLVDKFMPAGSHQIQWEADNIASGTYFYKLTSGDNSLIKKAVLIK